MASPDLVGALPRILDRMRCPHCSGALSVAGEALVCADCGTAFPVREGIPLLAVHGTAETWAADTSSYTSADYQRTYEDLGEASGYNEAYRRERTKRWSTEREYRILSTLLGTQPKSEVLLDLPSGGGRLSAALSSHTDLLVEADIGFGQLLYNRGNHSDREDRVWLTASAFHIPFRDAAMDGVVCCRLCHHLPTPEERERLVAELLRVARRFVIMTFFDRHSVKNLLRRARAPFNKKPPKMTMTVARVGELAAAGGAKLEAYPPLSHLVSGHRYALMVKR
ncbi:MAG: methyltransferase domain-containing protein [Gemmatimonadota bacterium]